MFTKHRLGVKDKGKCKVTAPTLWEGKKGKSEIRQRRKQFLILMVYVFKKMIIVSKISPKVFLIVFYPFFLTPNLDLLPVIQLARCRPVPPAYRVLRTPWGSILGTEAKSVFLLILGNFSKTDSALFKATQASQGSCHHFLKHAYKCLSLFSSVGDQAPNTASILFTVNEPTH